VGTAIRFQEVSKAFSLSESHQRHTTLKAWLSELARARGAPPRKFHRALENVSFEVLEGETLGIIGFNGSGKSTILRLAARIYRPDSGRITISGRVAALLELGGAFHPDFSGRENVALEGIMLGLSPAEIRERMDEIVEFAGLGDYIDQPVRTYSTGMFMRLAFSIAVRVRPEILLLDEILAVGDEAFVEKCRKSLEEMQARDMTIVLVTHDLRAVERWCDRALWLDRGMVRMLGSPGEVVRAYHEASAAYREAHGRRAEEQPILPS
jgi:lipopolysaccharide transport system ATP-binding protein